MTSSCSLKDSLHGHVIADADIEKTDLKLGEGSYGIVVKMILKGKPVAGKKIHSLLLESGDAGIGDLVARFKEECLRYVCQYIKCMLYAYMCN